MKQSTSMSGASARPWGMVCRSADTRRGLDSTLALIVSWVEAALGTVANVISGIANLNPASPLD